MHRDSQHLGEMCMIVHHASRAGASGDRLNVLAENAATFDSAGAPDVRSYQSSPLTMKLRTNFSNSAGSSKSKVCAGTAIRDSNIRAVHSLE